MQALPVIVQSHFRERSWPPFLFHTNQNIFQLSLYGVVVLLVLGTNLRQHKDNGYHQIDDDGYGEPYTMVVCPTCCVLLAVVERQV